MVMVVTVLRSGGDYTPEHVLTLKAMVERVMPWRGNFVCLTDMRVEGVHTIPLIRGWPGWWSKVEMFRPGLFREPVVYFDLDTLIMERFSLHVEPGDFWMLKDWYKPRFASGMMAWRGDFSFLFTRMPARPDPQDGDQEYIYAGLMAAGVVPKVIQKQVQVMSYKRHCDKGRGPRDAQVVCFHGKPRPWNAPEPWVKEVYHARA